MKYVWKIIVIVLFISVAGVIVLTKNSDSNETVSVKTAEQKLPKLLDLGSHNCIPCKLMMPILDSLTNEYEGALEVEFIDVWEKREAGEKYQISSIPTQIFFDENGVELFRHEGFWSKDEILNKFNELGITL